ncbi:MAG: winged helix-turn-helix transcriptional regulator [Thermoproteota archaeon]|nr:winged helix-turn-helix transcriptional regulator [Thermoproteota archaeon]
MSNSSSSYSSSLSLPQQPKDNPVLSFSYQDNKNKKSKRSILLDIITCFPGIRYRELLRITKLNNGTLSHHLGSLEKSSTIKVLRQENSNITRYYPASTPSEETVIRGYLKINTTKQIIELLYREPNSSFSNISSHINRAPSTTSWNLKRLLDAQVISKTKRNDSSGYSLQNPALVEKLIEKNNNTRLDRTIDNYSSLIDEL